MTVRHVHQLYPRLLSLVLACLHPFVVNAHTEEWLGEKRAMVAMRMIGHEVLQHIGDSTSRVLPIEKVNDQYKIPFEKEFGFDPADMMAIIDRVMRESQIGMGYMVEVEQCETQAVVHSFWLNNIDQPPLTPCAGRVLPKDCYQLFISLLELPPGSPTISSVEFDSSAVIAASERYSEAAPISPSPLSNSGTYALFLILIVLLIAGMGYVLRKKEPVLQNPYMVHIGNFQFDKRNMTLSFEDKEVELSNKETELLTLLHTSANEPITREIMLQEVWGDEGHYVGRTLDVFISKLRKKLQADTNVKIVNIRGVGYKLVMNESA